MEEGDASGIEDETMTHAQYAASSSKWLNSKRESSTDTSDEIRMNTGNHNHHDKAMLIDMDDGVFWRNQDFLNNYRNAEPQMKQRYSHEKEPLVSVGENYVADMGKVLGKGYFGKIYVGKEKHGGEPVAVKVGDPKTLKNEYMIYGRLTAAREKFKDLQAHHRHFVQMLYMDASFRHRGQHGKSALVLELLGKDLGKLFEETRQKFSAKTIFMIGIQLLRCLEQLHAADILHCDLKPENFLVGRRNSGKEGRIFVVDFGMAKEYRTNQGSGGGGSLPSSREEEGVAHHVENDHKRHGIRGTIRYISINSHKGMARSRRDEIESLSYVLLYFAHAGWLPWRGLRKTKEGNNRNASENLTKSHNHLVLEVKENTPTAVLCRGVPHCYREILEKAKRMEFKERPDYKGLRGLLEEEMKRRELSLDFVFDWMLSHNHNFNLGPRSAR